MAISIAQIALSNISPVIFKAQISYLESTSAFLLACLFSPPYLMKTKWLKNSYLLTAEPGIRSNSSGLLCT